MVLGVEHVVVVAPTGYVVPQKRYSCDPGYTVEDKVVTVPFKLEPVDVAAPVVQEEPPAGRYSKVLGVVPKKELLLLNV